MSDLLLEVKNLRTHFQLEEGLLKAVDGVWRGALKHCLRQIDALIRFFREASYFDTPETRAILLRCLQETRNRWATEGWRTLMGLEVNISA